MVLYIFVRTCFIMHPMKKYFVILFAILLASCNRGPGNPEIYQWSGSNRDGFFSDTGLLASWPDDGPELLWFAEGIGNGYGSPTISNDRIYITGELDSTGYLSALGLDGKLIWKVAYGPEYTISFQGSRSTPTYYNGKIFVCSGEGRVSCFNAEDGREEWRKEMIGDLNGRMNRFGYSQSLLVDENYVYCQPGGPDTNVVALDKESGKLAWFSKAEGEISAYCSPVIISQNGQEILVTFSEHNLLGLDPGYGEQLWSVEQDTFCDIHGNTPLFKDGFLYSTTGCGNMTEKWQLSDDGTSITRVWKNSSLDNYMGGNRIVDGSIIGAGERKKFLKRVNLESGLTIDSLAIGNGNIIEADDKLYYYTVRGELHLVKAYPDSLVDVSSFRISLGTKEHFSHPVIAHGILYLRHGDVLMAYEINN